MTFIHLVSDTDEFDMESPLALRADGEAALAWHQFPSSEPLQAWARQLHHALHAGGDAQATWDLTGRAVIVECDDDAFRRAMARRIATDAEMTMLAVGNVTVGALAPFDDLC